MWMISGTNQDVGFEAAKNLVVGSSDRQSRHFQWRGRSENNSSSSKSQGDGRNCSNRCHGWQVSRWSYCSLKNFTDDSTPWSKMQELIGRAHREKLRAIYLKPMLLDASVLPRRFYRSCRGRLQRVTHLDSFSSLALPGLRRKLPWLKVLRDQANNCSL